MFCGHHHHYNLSNKQTIKFFLVIKKINHSFLNKQKDNNLNFDRN